MTIGADVSPHTVTADAGAFDSGNLDPGQAFSFTFGLGLVALGFGLVPARAAARRPVRTGGWRR